MKEAEFDEYAERYEALHAASIAITGEGPEYFAEYKIRDIARAVGRRATARGGSDGGARPALQVCDFGAGVGGSVPFVHRHLPGAQLTCLDVSRRSLEVAERRYPQMARYVHFDGLHLPLPDEQFDIAFAACVFHHIDHADHPVLLQELHRILWQGRSAGGPGGRELSVRRKRASDPWFDDGAAVAGRGVRRLHDPLPDLLSARPALPAAARSGHDLVAAGRTVLRAGAAVAGQRQVAPASGRDSTSLPAAHHPPQASSSAG